MVLGPYNVNEGWDLYGDNRNCLHMCLTYSKTNSFYMGKYPGNYLIANFNNVNNFGLNFEETYGIQVITCATNSRLILGLHPANERRC